MNAPLHTDRIDYGSLPPRWARIILDGDNGSGKTTLAKEMAGVLGANVVSLDDHLLENGAIYWNQIDYEVLRSKILAAGPRAIVEGVCILKVLGKIDIAHDYHIFIRLYSGILGWEYEQYLDERAKLPHSLLRKEIAEYYRQFRPFDVCDVILDRSVDRLV